MRSIVIIGNGIAGITAARHIRKHSRDSVTIISAESPYHFSRPALMYLYMGSLSFDHCKPYPDNFWKDNDLTLVHEYVEAIVPSQTVVRLSSGRDIYYDELIIATGSVARRLPFDTGDISGMLSFISLDDVARLERELNSSSKVLIVGGGLIGVELAEMMRSRGIDSMMVVRESSYWGNYLPSEESSIITRHLREKNVTVLYGREIKDCLQENGRLTHCITNHNEIIACTHCIVAIGVRPNIGVCSESGIVTSQGIVTDEYFRTSVPNVYAIGDCAEICFPDGTRSIEPLWYAGRRHGETVAQTICGSPRAYSKGIWFNSAKFFDVEFQEYGEKRSTYSLFYEFPDGRRSIRIVYDAERRVRGFMVLGVRYRHKVCEQWITEGASMDDIILRLEEANCDPEFTDRHESAIRALYERKKH